MIEFRTLENSSIDEILEVFNLSFSDYVIPLCLTEERLESKMLSDSIHLELSAGALENEKLIAFILHGFDTIDHLKVAYNAGTGVIPDKRGNKLTTRLYEYVFPVLSENDIDKVVLEVIITNETALKTYQNIGFQITKHFNCFKGTINRVDSNNSFEIRELEVIDWQKLHSFWDIKPSWQNSKTAVEKLHEITVSIGIYENEQLLGYAIYNPKMQRIYQLAIDRDHRRKGLASQLLKHISDMCGRDLSLINIDDNSEETSGFMICSGLNIFIEQYEMELNLKIKKELKLFSS